MAPAPDAPPRAAGLPRAPRRGRDRPDRGPRALPRQPRRPGRRSWSIGPSPCSHNELRVAESWGATFVNVHLGSHRGAGLASGIAGVATGLRRVLDGVDGGAPGVTLVLENGAGGGSGIGSTIDELARVEEAVVGAGVGRDRFGYCLDVAHLWGAGYAMDEPAGVDGVLREFDAAIGLRRLHLVHLNDSRSERGSRTDQHEHLGAGLIGAAGPGAHADPPGPRRRRVPARDAGDGRGLRPREHGSRSRPRGGTPARRLLPPEAFETSSSKGRSAPADDDVEEINAREAPA